MSQQTITDLRTYRRNICIHQAAQARRVSELAAQYARALVKDDGRLLDLTDYAEFQLINAICELISDGDIVDRRKCIMDSLRIDYDGNPLRGEVA